MLRHKVIVNVATKASTKQVLDYQSKTISGKKAEELFGDKECRYVYGFKPGQTVEAIEIQELPEEEPETEDLTVKQKLEAVKTILDWSRKFDFPFDIVSPLYTMKKELEAEYEVEEFRKEILS